MNMRLLPYRPERDAYRLLGVDPSATTDEILAACRRLTRTFHPDFNRSPRANQEMQVVNGVRSVMTNPELRREYDVARRLWYARGPIPSAAPTGSPIVRRPRRRPSTAQYARAGWLGVQAALTALAPLRCSGCRMVIDGDDFYCAACGTQLLPVPRPQA